MKNVEDDFFLKEKESTDESNNIASYEWEKNYNSKMLVNFKYFQVYFKDNFKRICVENDHTINYNKYVDVIDDLSNNNYNPLNFNEHNLFFNEYLINYENKRLKLIDEKQVNELYEKVKSSNSIIKNGNKNYKHENKAIDDKVNLKEKLKMLENHFMVPIKKNNYNEIVEWMSYNPYISQNEFNIINEIHRKTLYEILAFYTPFNIGSVLLITNFMTKILKIKSLKSIFLVNCIFSSVSVILSQNYLKSILLIKNLKNEPLLMGLFYKSYI